MIKIMSENLRLVLAVTLLGPLFIFGVSGEFTLDHFVMVVWLVLAVLAWKPLHKRFRAWAILFSYFQFSIPLIQLSDPSATLSGLLEILFLVFAISAIVLLFNRQKPIEQRRPDLAFMILNGHWELLANDGVPADEIERMKRLTQEERAALWAALSKGRGGDSSAQRLARSKELGEWVDELRTNPAYSSSIGNAHHRFDD